MKYERNDSHYGFRFKRYRDVCLLCFYGGFLLLYICCYGYPIWKKIQEVKEFSALLADYSNENINYNYEACGTDGEGGGFASVGQGAVVTECGVGDKMIHSSLYK